MNQAMLSDLMSAVAAVDAALDTSPEDWRDQLPAARNITTSLELLDTSLNDERRWQVSVIRTLQRLAYADADSGGVQDISNWCLRQSLSLLQTSPENVELLKLIGTNWLLRAQKSLARIHFAERDSSSSGASQQSKAEEPRHASSAMIEVEARLWTADYVEARGILLPATDYLKRAVDAARSQGLTTACLLTGAAEAYMSLGNVSPSRINEQYFNQAISYLRAASQVPNYTLPIHLQQYLDEYGPLHTEV